MNGREPFPGLVVRPVAADDLDRVVATFKRLSPESTYRASSHCSPTPARSSRATWRSSTTATTRRFVVLDGDDVVAIAQWDRLGCCPDEAEMAITVEDAWQHLGLGRALVRAIAADAHDHGVGTLTANISPTTGRLSGSPPACGPGPWRWTAPRPTSRSRSRRSGSGGGG